MVAESRDRQPVDGWHERGLFIPDVHVRSPKYHRYRDQRLRPHAERQLKHLRDSVKDLSYNRAPRIYIK